MDLLQKFSFGVNIDDPWRYAGVAEPKSIIIPHLLSLSIPEGGRLDSLEASEISAFGDQEPHGRVARASLALADNLKSIGVDFVRCWFPWSFFEPIPIPASEVPSMADSSYPSYPMDNFVETLTSKGIEIVPVLACGYQRMLPNGLSVDSDPTRYLRRAYAHARLVVRRYKGRVHNWQIENEPNWWEMHEAGGWRTGASWRSRPFRDELIKLLNEAVHEEDSSATTVINLEADRGVRDFQDYANCDALGFDFYPNYKSSDPVNPAVVGEGKNLAKSAGKPCFIAETGYPSGPSVLGYSQQKQAEYVTGAVSEAFHTEALNAIGIWRYVDTAWRSFPEQENHFGLIDEKGGPKLGWNALRDAIRDLRR